MGKIRNRSDRRTWHIIRVPPCKREEVPPSSMTFAVDRVSYLQGQAFKHPLQYLLACAYLQGINDCVEAHIRNPSLSKDSPHGR